MRLDLQRKVAWCCALWVMAWTGCGENGREPPDFGERVTIVIDPQGPVGSLDPRYIGFAFDTAQFSFGMWWQAGSDERQVAETPDLESPKLRRLAAHLAPSLIRVGGTDCEAYYFCEQPGECALPPEYQDTFKEDNRREGVITHEDVERLSEFAAAVDGEVLFCINMGPGPREPATCDWQPDNARALIRFATGLPNGHVFGVWEPGNEVNSMGFNFNVPCRVSAERFAVDLGAFALLLADEDPGASISAPGSYVTPFGELGGSRRS